MSSRSQNIDRHARRFGCCGRRFCGQLLCSSSQVDHCLFAERRRRRRGSLDRRCRRRPQRRAGRRQRLRPCFRLGLRVCGPKLRLRRLGRPGGWRGGLRGRWFCHWRRLSLGLLLRPSRLASPHVRRALPALRRLPVSPVQGYPLSAAVHLRDNRVVVPPARSADESLYSAINLVETLSIISSCLLAAPGRVTPTAAWREGRR